MEILAPVNEDSDAAGFGRAREGLARIEIAGDTTYVGRSSLAAPTVGDVRISPGEQVASSGLISGRQNDIHIDIADLDFAFTPNGAWNDCDSSGIAHARRGDIVIPNVAPGQWVEWGLSAYAGAPTAGIFLDAWTIVDGVAINKFMGQLSGGGPSSYLLLEGKDGAVGGTTLQYKVKPEDIEGGSVRIRLRQKGSAQPQLIMYGTVGFAIQIWGNGPIGPKTTPQLVFDGQSFNYAPVSSAPYPNLLLNMLEGQAFGVVVGKSGTTYAQRNTDVVTRTDSLFANSEMSVVLDVGGVSDLFSVADGGAGLTAAQTLSAAQAYANNRKAAGADYVIGFTVTNSTQFANNATANNNRVSYNNMLRESAVHDAIVDQAAFPEFQDPNDTAYFYDGLHPTAAGATLIAQAAHTALQNLGVVV